MERVFLYEIDKEYLSKLPEASGILGFYHGETLLCITATGNLLKRVNQIFALQDTDTELQKVFLAADSFLWEAYDTMLSALIAAKLFTDTMQPEYGSALQVWKSYPYLALNPAEFPFIKLTDFTDEDWVYIGPFRSRFFLIDLMDLLQRLLKLPYCEVHTPPCEKLESGVCKGWCMLIRRSAEDAHEQDDDSAYADLKPVAADASQPDDSPLPQPDPDLLKLDALLKEAFMHPDNGLLELLQREKAKYESKLEFIKADLLTDQIELLSKYKAWLIFLYAAKQLSYQNESITVTGGQLTRYTVGGKEFTSPYVNVKYRATEALALNKNLVDEAWILYEEFRIKNYEL